MISKIPTKKYDIDRLFSYALWYSGKYRSSKAKLAQKLMIKGATEAEIATVFEAIAPYHSDEIEIRTFAQNSILAGKSMRNFSQKMVVKGFKKSDIDMVLTQFSEQLSQYGTFEKEIHRRFNSLITRGYGPKSIYSDLVIKYPKLKEQIQSLISTLDESELLNTMYRDVFCVEQSKKNNLKSNKKLFDMLVRRGFGYDAVTRFLSKKQ